MKIGEQHLDEAEDIDIELYDLEDLLLMCYSGELQDAKTVAAIMAYAAKIQK
jgi:ADP-ribose pyrophosphatase